MKTIKIKIIDTHLEDIGIDQQPEYTDFKFNESQLIGYWLSKEDNEIRFYVNGMSFVSDITNENIKILDDALNVSQFVL